MDLTIQQKRNLELLIKAFPRDKVRFYMEQSRGVYIYPDQKTLKEMIDNGKTNDYK